MDDRFKKIIGFYLFPLAARIDSRFGSEDRRKFKREESHNKYVGIKTYLSIDLDERPCLKTWNSLIEKAFEDDPLTAVWVLERYGFLWAKYLVENGRTDHLSEEGYYQEHIDNQYQFIFSVGIGLYLTELCLKERNPYKPFGDWLKFFCLIKRHTEVAQSQMTLIEAFGFYHRCNALWRPSKTVLEGDRYFSKHWEDCRHYYWHGVGRALYFNPRLVLPADSLSRVLSVIEKEALNQQCYDSMLTGLAWAFTMVNYGSPAIIERAIEQLRIRGDLDHPFFQGIVGAAYLRSHLSKGKFAMPSYLKREAKGKVGWTFENMISRKNRGGDIVFSYS